jgi:hypothetical protein
MKVRIVYDNPGSGIYAEWGVEAGGRTPQWIHYKRSVGLVYDDGSPEFKADWAMLLRGNGSWLRAVPATGPIVLEV